MVCWRSSISSAIRAIVDFRFNVQAPRESLPAICRKANRRRREVSRCCSKYAVEEKLFV